MTEGKMKVLLIIPAYNEAENIVRVVNNLTENFPEYDYVVINDGSSDNTAELCKKHGFNMIDLPVNLGLARAFQTGMRYADRKGYDFALQYDGDGQHNPAYIAQMIEAALKDELDIVIGSRYINQGGSFTPRMIGNRLIGCCIFLTTGKQIKDSTSGMRLYNKRMISILGKTMNYGPEPDTIAYLIRCGASIGEVPVKMNERIAGQSYLNFSRIIQYMFHICSSILIVQWFRKRRL